MHPFKNHPRSRRVALLAAFVVLIGLALPRGVRGDEAKETFDTLFAAKIKAAAGTADRADEVALAKEILALAKASTNQAELVTLLCDAAHDVAAKHADGYGAAAEAMELLAETVEQKRPAAREKLIAVLTRQSSAGKPDEREPAAEKLVELLVTIGDEKAEKKNYADAAGDYRRAMAIAQQKKFAAADDVKAKLDWAAARDKALKQIARLQEKLLANANDSATAEEIVKLYLVELDDPSAALPFLDRAKDEKLKKLVPLAVRRSEDLNESDALELAEWYTALTTSAKPESVNVVIRGQRYCKQFLSLHAERDIQRIKVEAMLAGIEKTLEKQPVVRRPAKTMPKGPAFFTVSGEGYAIAKLSNDEKAFSNRGYVWLDVPKELDGWGFTRVAGGGKRTLRIEVTSPGVIFVASNLQPSNEDWKQVPKQSFIYSDPGKSRLFVYARAVAKGDAIDIEQSAGWIGTLLLIPPGHK